MAFIGIKEKPSLGKVTDIITIKSISKDVKYSLQETLRNVNRTVIFTSSLVV